jgi:glucose-6-phosphate 1-dehydrogenase
MTASALQAAGPYAMVILGAAGGPTKRKLMPALCNLKANGLLPRELAIIGVARRPETREAFRAAMSRELREVATAKRPGTAIELHTVKLDFGDTTPATGDERLIHDSMVGDMTLLHRADIAEAAWAIATPILDVWRSLPPRDFPSCPAGSMGPAAADRLMERGGRAWWPA